METVTAEQGTQPRFGDVRVGIMRVGEKEGVPTARLAVRTPDDTQIVDLGQGAPLSVAGHGTLSVIGAHPPTGPNRRARVDLQWDPQERGDATK